MGIYCAVWMGEAEVIFLCVVMCTTFRNISSLERPMWTLWKLLVTLPILTSLLWLHRWLNSLRNMKMLTTVNNILTLFLLPVMYYLILPLFFVWFWTFYLWIFSALSYFHCFGTVSRVTRIRPTRSPCHLFQNVLFQNETRMKNEGNS